MKVPRSVVTGGAGFIGSNLVDHLVGIGHEVTRYYSKAIKITDVQELGDVMIEQLSGLFVNKKKLN